PTSIMSGSLKAPGRAYPASGTLTLTMFWMPIGKPLVWSVLPTSGMLRGAGVVLVGIPDQLDVLGGAPDVRHVTPVALGAGLGVDAVGVDAVEDRPSGGGPRAAHLCERGGLGRDCVV